MAGLMARTDGFAGAARAGCCNVSGGGCLLGGLNAVMRAQNACERHQQPVGTTVAGMVRCAWYGDQVGNVGKRVPCAQEGACQIGEAGQPDLIRWGAGMKNKPVRHGEALIGTRVRGDARHNHGECRASLQRYGVDHARNRL